MKNCYYSVTKIFMLAMLFVTSFGISETQAQCAYLGSQGATANASTCPGATTATINPGEFVSISVTAGATYTFSVCGNTTCDTQITLFGAGGATNLGYNDDGCGLQSTITWVATFTGTVELQLNTYNCATAGGTCNNTVVDISCTGGGGGGGPANDDPCGAVNLPVGTNCTFTTYDNTGATATTGIPAPGCASYVTGDVWFTATIPASGGITFDSNTGGITDGGMAAYSAPACTGPFTLLSCDDDGSANGLMPSLQVNGNPGDIIYIRMWEYGGNTFGTFDICAEEYVPPPPPAGCNGNPAAGDNCTLATPICDLNGYCGNTSAQYSAGAVTPFCGSVENNSWMTFVADGTTVDITVDVSNNTGSGVQFALYSTTDCITFTYATGAAGTSCYSPINGLGNNISFPNLTPGQTYFLMVDGFAGDVADYQITAQGGIAVGVDAGPDVTICEGQSTTLTATNATNYSWVPGGSTNASITVSPTATTTYTVSTTGGNPNCPQSASDDVIVTVNPVPTVTVSPDVSICQGGAGTTLTAGGADTYSWSPATGLSSTTGGTVTANPAATTTYTVTGTTNGCTNTATVTVTVTPPPTVTITPAASTICFGDQVTLNASGASTYTWSPATGLSATTGSSVQASPTTTTTYTVTGSDPGCPDDTETVTVTVEPQIVPNFSITGNQCLSTNSITFTNTGTVGTYQWDFTGGVASQTGSPVTVTFPSATTFNVTLTTTVGACSEQITIPVTIYPDPAVTATGTDVSCNGAADGTINASSPNTGGFSWDSGQNTAGPHNVGPGTYTVTFTDLNSCTATDVVTINEPPALAVTTTSADVSCFGVCDGDVGANAATGGTPPYTYTWDNGLGAGQSHNNVCAGTYTVTVTDANGCTATATATVNAPTALAVTTTSADASCNGVCDGDVGSNATGGTAPYTYSWNGGLGAGQNQTGSVCAGTYTVTVTDANGCTATANATVNQPTPVTVTASGTDADCNGAATGSVSASGAGGTGPYTYNWDNGLGAGATHNNVAAGTYTVTITDANGCTATDSYTVNEPTVLTASVTPADATCNGVCDGSATVAASGGTPPYTYQWDAAGGLGTAATASNLCAGTPGVTVTDANGCTVVVTGTINEPTLLTVTTSSADASCDGVCDGDVGATGAGGTGPYTYTWDNGLGAGQNQTGVVCAGTYNVTVTDANGCTATAPATVNEPTAVTVTTSSADASCSGVCDGDVGANGAGGTGPYTYTWDNGLGAGQNQTGVVCAGTYTVTVTDANGCTATATATVNEPTPVTVTTSSTDADCNGAATGSVAATGAGGTGPYTYNWDNGLGSGSSQTGVAAGTYTVTVTDANGCTTTGTVTVNEPTALTATVTPADATCNGVCDGQATVVAAGGTAPYTYQWDAAGGLGTAATATGLCVGLPGVTVTDANGCTVFESAAVNEPTIVIAATTSADASCNGVCDGDVGATASGGTGPYTYTWDGGLGAGQNHNGVVCAGTYNVTVTDANGCTATASATVNEPTLLTAATTSADASCNGVCDGDVGATGAGGTAPYTYTWDNGLGAGQNQTGVVCAGFYTVTVTDANGCTATASATVGEPSAVSVTASATDADCNGAATGSVAATGAGGTGPYTYNWDNGLGAGSSHTAVAAGTYTVTVTDANGCTATGTATVNEPTALGVTVTPTDATCNGICDGQATVVASGGTAPYTYQWDAAGGLGTAATATGICAGTPGVTVTDANGCTAFESTVVNEPTAITLSTSTTDPTCGNTDGDATVVAAGGTGPYTYSWSSGGVAATETGLGAGGYTVDVTDAAGCTAQATVTLTDAGAPTATITASTDVNCAGGNNGNATVSASGGTGPYDYLWSPAGGTGTTASSLGAGSYTVTVTDAIGCVATASVTITEPTALTAGITASADATCNGVCDGSATVTISGGTPPYSYLWDNGAGTADNATGLCAGTTYTVTATDANGCAIQATFTPAEPALLTANITGTDATCFGVCDGAADLTVAGGTAPYTYLWDNAATSEDINSLCAGTFNVTVTDANGCTAIASVTINEPADFVLTPGSVNANCGAADGEVSITVTGGTGPYTYDWQDAGATTVGTTATVTGLPSGTYTVFITDAAGCTADITSTINDNAGGTAAITVDNDASCNGVCDGQATVVPAGGTPPYTYLWSSGGTAATETGLCAGAVSVDVTDANGCVASATATITEPTALTAGITASTDATCNGVCDGDATVTASGGTPPYTYVWTSGGTTDTETGLCAGTHDVTVTDANGCTIVATATIAEPTLLTASIVGTDLICNGICDGAADLTVAGGTAPYTYAWDNAVTSEDISSLCAGTYNVTVTDANGCTAIASVTLVEPAALSLPTATVNSNCGSADGEVTVAVAGGTGPYTYDWQDAGATTVGTTATVTGLPSGTYTVYVTDANGCTADNTATINDNSGGTAAITVDNNVSCFGICDGQATVVPAGGTAPYTYLWSSGGTAATETGLCAGTVSVDVTDANGCVASATATITEPTDLTAGITASNDVTCNAVCDGDATVTASGGTPPYTYAWTSGGTTDTETGLCAGTHDVTVTDANGCTVVASVTINEPPVLTAAVVGTDALCNAQCDGSADLTVGGGTAPYTYAWDNAATSEDISGLCAGSYNVTVTDANGCTAVASVTINEPTVLTAPVTVTDANCGQADGSACAAAAGGTGPYTYLWSDGQVAQCANGLAAGSYSVDVTDANGCTVTENFTINDIPGGTATAAVVSDVTIAGTCDGEATVTMAGGTAPFTYLWDDAGAQTTQNATGLCAGTYCVTVTDANGCTTTSCITINEPGALVVNIVGTDLLCNGVCDGATDITVSGGIPPYTYLWNTSATAEDLTGLCAGTYDVTVTDANGATGTATVTLIEPTALGVTNTSVIHVTCNGACNGSAAVNVTGGTAPLSYDWVDDATGASVGTTSNVTNLCPGNYTATVTDANGCIIIANVTVNEPGPIVLTTNANDANCGQPDGEVSVLATGGTGVYVSYEWFDANPTLVGSTATVTGLVAGTYTITVTDDNSCVETATVTINNNAAGTAASVVNTNVSCNGVCDGSATVNMTGGVAPFTYLWSTGGTNQTETTLCAGTHTIDVTDATGCVASTTVTITEPAVLALAEASVDASCNGTTDGEVSVVPTGGTAGYTYDWVDQATGISVGTTATVAGLPAGTYCVTVTDNNGCVETVCATINEPTAILVNTASTDASCGQSDGSVSATASGGSGTYVSYDWTQGATPVGNGTTVGTLPAGSYDVLVTDDTGCTGTGTVTIGDLTGPTATFVSQVDVSCNGLSDGEATINATGGTAPLTYAWTPSGGNATTATGLAAGNYTVTVTDANGCTDNFLVTINEPPVLTVGVTGVTDVSGAGLCDGDITVTAAGGTAPYSYAWYDDNTYTNPIGQTTATATGLCAQEYCVIVTDANGCTDSICATPASPNAITTVLTGVDPLCAGSCDGSIDAVVAGGVPPYTYQWFQGANPGTAIGGATTIPLTGLCAGTYYLQVTDANGIIHISEDEIIVDPAPITANVNVISNYNGQDVTCNGACDGSAEVVPTGGTPPYTYEWFDNATGFTTNQFTAIATGLCAGTYDVEVTDANNCVNTFSVTLTEPTVITNSFTIIDASCNGESDGSIQTAASGGTPPYTYQWNNGALSTTADITGEPAGTYDVTITDANGCSITQSATINEPIALVLASTMTGSNCNQNDGDATVTIVNGVGPFTYQWDAAAGSQTTATATNLFAGCYMCVVTDANSCQDSIQVCVIDLGSPTVNVLGTTDVSCFGGCDGFAQIQVAGGTAPFAYEWYDDLGNPIGQQTASAFNLCAGVYSGQITDANGCIASVPVTITEPTILNVAITNSTDVTCFGYCDGEATVTASGATGPYSYLWSDAGAQTTATATGLCPGTYTVTVTDAQACDSTISVTIGEPVNILTSTSSVATFCGQGMGSATVAVTSGGVAPITFLWDNGQPTATATGLTPGWYYVTITDANGCAVIDSAEVFDTPAGTATVSNTTNVSCNGFTDGTATVSSGGTGTPPYTYEWYNGSGNPIGQQTQTATGLAAGDYYCVVTDINGCVATTALAAVTEPVILGATVLETDASCFAACDGEASLGVTGGTFPITYSWNDPLQQNTITATGLCAGTYTATITDGNGCIHTIDAIIDQPTPITLDSTVVNANCGQPDGQGCVIAAGGTPPYTYFWPATGGTNSCEVGLVANTYLVEVTDANGCVEIISIEIQDLNGPSAAIIAQTEVTCNGLCDGSATVDMVGGSGSFFTVAWDAGAGSQVTPTAGNLCAGVYTVSITDDLGCSASASVTITEPDAITYSQQFTDPTCFGDCDGTALLNAIGGTQPYTYDWFSVTTATSIGTTNSVTGLCSGDYILTLTDANGCTEIVNYTITDPLAPTSTGTATDASCAGFSDGTATASGIVGVQPFTYAWDAATGNQTTQTATGLAAGTYTCIVTDADGCTSTVTVTVNEPTVLQASITTFGNVSCAGFCDGFAQVDVTGGTPGYFFSWSNNGGINQVASNLCAGTYTVTVTDGNLCTTTAQVTIVEPNPMSVVSNTTPVSCFSNCDGAMNVLVSGGTAPLSYQWDDPTFATTSAVNNVCAGTYTCTITDANGCQITETVVVTQPTALQISATLTDANCGQNNGEICVNVFGGQFPYTYQWNDPNTQTGSCAQNLLAGCYQLIVTDGNGCNFDTLLCINDISGPTITLNNVVDVTCNGSANGSISVNVAGGTVPYATTTWTDGQGTPLPQFDGLTAINGLSGDCYAVTVVDAAGCVATFQQCVTEPQALSAAVTASTNVSCFGGSNGDATVSQFGGIPPYTYSWTSGDVTQTAVNLPAGTYVATVTDANFCTITAQITITEPPVMTIATNSITDVSCFGLCDGAINAAASGGVSPYLYTWQPAGGTGTNATNLCAGTYQVKVTDANGCIDSLSATVNQPTELLLSATTIDASCGFSNGEATVTPSGGTPTYAYTWPTGNTPTAANNTGLPIGTTTMTVTDLNGCTKQIDVLINDQPGPTIDSVTFSAPTCNGLQNGSATVHYSGGTPPYTYLWDDPSAQVSSTAIALPAGNYCVTVTDANGCITAGCVTVTEPAPLVPVPDIDRTICYGDSTQVWANGAGGTQPYTIDWVGGVFPQNSTGPNSVTPLITTDYCFTITDANGCISAPGCITITVTPPLDLDLTPDVSICDGDAIQLTAQATGGNGGTVTFEWHEGTVGGPILLTDSSGITSDLTVNPSTPTWYYVILSDGCSLDAIDSVLVSINPNPVVFLNIPDSAGCAPYTSNFIANTDIGINYEWDFDCDGNIDYTGPDGSPSWTYDIPGTYDVCVTVYSADGCSTVVNMPAAVQVYSVPVADFVFTPEETTFLNPTIFFSSTSTGATNYTWDFGDGTILSGIDTIYDWNGTDSFTVSAPNHTYQDTGIFTITLTVSNEWGCTDAISYQVHIEGDYIIFAPSAFTPNGDGINDVWFPKGVGINDDNYELFIFNRWGEIIFESRDKNIGWDGLVKGTQTLAEVEVYVYLIRTVDHKGEAHEYIGHVTVVR